MQLILRSAFSACPAAIATLALAACVPPSPQPTPRPSPAASPTASPAPAPVVTQPPTPEPSAAPPQVVTPAYDKWMDAPQTPGNWRYVDDPGETLAVFGPGTGDDEIELIVRCDRQTRRVGLARTGEAAGQVEMLVRTETQERNLTAGPLETGRSLIAAELAPGDTLLDAIAFSRGRFAIDVAGTPGVYAPAYPEITRVIEDCR